MPWHKDPDLGPCCACGGTRARNIWLLPRKGNWPGQGWGCLQCGLPMDGAIAVLCDACSHRFARAPDTPELWRSLAHYCANDGTGSGRGRAPIEELFDAPVWEHDLSQHPETGDRPGNGKRFA